MDAPYRPEDVDPEVRPVFEQLRMEFEAEYEVRTRVDNFGRWLDAGIVNRARRVVAEVEVMRGRRTRTAPLSASQLRRIRGYLSAGGAGPLRIALPRRP